MKETPETRKWRALVRIERFDKEHAYIVLPGWNAKEEIRIVRSTIPNEIQNKAANGFPIRCHVKVNKGAYEVCDLIFSDWEKE